MITPYSIALNGTALSSLDEAICILDIREDAPVMRSTAVGLYGGGQRLLRRERESLSVQASFAIQEPDAARRQEIFRSVLRWAENGGFLSITGRTGQQLRVICADFPVLHAEDWTETLHITFSTTAVPCWEAIAMTSVTTSSASTLTPEGDAGSAVVNVQAVNNGDEPVTELTLTCGDTQMSFSGLSLAAGAALSLRCTDGILIAEAGGKSMLRYRTSDSDDLLLAPCGRSCPVSVSADQAVTATFSVRGRYL